MDVSVELYYKNFKGGYRTAKASTKFLSLHQRAVVTANHPDRLKETGIFEI
jgi:hypothetical protein